MATQDTSTGNIIAPPSGNMSGSTPEQQTAFMNNITKMLTDAQQSAQPSRDALLAQKSGLEVGQAGLGAVSANNPLAFLYNMAPNDAKASMYTNTSNMFNPGIASIQGQIQAGDQRVQNVRDAISGMKDTMTTQNELNKTKIQAFQATHVYNPAINPLTQQPFGWSTAPGTDTGLTNPQTPRMVGSINTGAYGAADPEYDSKLKNYQQSVKSQMPSGQYDPTIADSILKSHHSSITSSMVGLAASQYGLDPSDLLAQTGLETVYGSSNIATEDNNPGGVEWANQSNATQGSPRPANEGGFYAKFKTMQDGLYAMAKISATPTSISTPSQNNQPMSIASNVVQDASDLASGKTAPQVLQDRYTKAGTPALYLQVVALAKQINPTFDETAANLKYQGQQTQTENMNSGNPITSIFSNAKNLMSETTPSILSPVKNQGSVYNGIRLPY